MIPHGPLAAGCAWIVREVGCPAPCKSHCWRGRNWNLHCSFFYTMAVLWQQRWRKGAPPFGWPWKRQSLAGPSWSICYSNFWSSELYQFVLYPTWDQVIICWWFSWVDQADSQMRIEWAIIKNAFAVRNSIYQILTLWRQCLQCTGSLFCGLSLKPILW